MPSSQPCRLARFVCLVAFLAGLPAAALAQSASGESSPAEPPPIRRWVDVQHVQMSTRFRWVESTEGVVNSSTLQWQPQLRARFLVDRGAKYSVHVGAFSGSSLVSGWNNTGAGIGEYAGAFNVKQLFVAAAPTPGLEFQVGGLYMLRGENTEITSYDNDVYMMGERASWHPEKGPITQLAITAGYLGDPTTPNLFERTNRIGQWNYGQALVGWRMGRQLTASADYTYEDGRDILRQGITLHLPASLKMLTAVKIDAYERLSPLARAGFNAAVEVRPIEPLRITIGAETIDHHYGPFNADRYLVGTHFYTQGTYDLTDDVSIGWFHGEAFAVHQPLSNQHRLELLLTVNPTATLRRQRVF